jgi:FMN phosphatase YigB (HAD superfamily)
MIKAVLLDLDDTLILSDTDRFFLRYLRMLGEELAGDAPSDDFVYLITKVYEQALDSYDPSTTLYERFVKLFSSRIGLSEARLSQAMDRFYRLQYPKLRPMVKPRPVTRPLLDWLFDRGYQVVVATNPAVPLDPIHQRMTWGGISPERYPFRLITGMENMHFGKPRAAYYEEILVRLGLEAHEAIMVGDRWDDDVAGAASIGLATYWVTGDGTALPDESAGVDGYGDYDRFCDLVTGSWLDTLTPRQPGVDSLLTRLTVFPAAVDSLLRDHSPYSLEACPRKGEWSVRDILCHLTDYAVEDRARFERIIREDNPFLSANYDPWAGISEYSDLSVADAFSNFVSRRAELVDWLRTLPAPTWRRPARHPVFGPTSLLEMVKFTSEHDRTHLRQMSEAAACTAPGSAYSPAESV